LDIPEFMLNYTASIFDELLRRYGRPASIIAESQAAGGVALYLQKVRDNVGQLILLQPLGLNTHEYTRSPSLYSELQRRVNHNFLHQIPSLITDLRLLFNHAFLIRTIKPGTSKARAQYEAGLVCCILDPVKELFLDGIPIHIVSGEHDILFPPAEIRSNLDAAGMGSIPISIVPKTPHSPLSTRAGRLLLDEAIRISRRRY
jgi:pimeloyl-ACP methyl ester carboxylesterase